MKKNFSFLIVAVTHILVACSPMPQAGEVAPPSPPNETQTPTLTSTSSATATPTITPSPTQTATPTVEIAASGYDIAAVSVENLKPDAVRIRFYYRIPDNVQMAYITLNIPPACRDAYYWQPSDYPNVAVARKVDWAEIEFKHSLQGSCESNITLLQIWPVERAGNLGIIGDVIYEERFEVSYQATRDLPSLNANNLTIRNFNFEALGNWTGQITFDYLIDPLVPIETENIRFHMRGITNACHFQNSGRVISEHNGTYTIRFNLLEDLHSYYSNLKNTACLEGYDYFTFNDYYFYATQEETGDTAVFRSISLSTTFTGKDE